MYFNSGEKKSYSTNKGKLKFRVKTSVHEVTKDDMALKIITWMRHVHTKMYPSALGKASEGSRSLSVYSTIPVSSLSRTM